jgi:hypothetical protein
LRKIFRGEGSKFVKITRGPKNFLKKCHSLAKKVIIFFNRKEGRYAVNESRLAGRPQGLAIPDNQESLIRTNREKVRSVR